MKPYRIHSKKAVPNIAINYNERMEEDEVYAIETFPTFGNGSVYHDKICNHYMINNYDDKMDENTKKIYNFRSTLAFCPRWFNFNIPDTQYISKFPVLISDGLVAQTEKSVYIKSDSIIILN
jgi:methionyl aminopeptidase